MRSLPSIGARGRRCVARSSTSDRGTRTSPRTTARIVSISSSKRPSFATKPEQPDSSACASVAPLDCPVSITTSVSGNSALMRAVASPPVPSGSRKSMTTTSGRSARAASTPARTETALPTTSKSASIDSARLSVSAIRSWSSTMRTRVAARSSPLIGSPLPHSSRRARQGRVWLTGRPPLGTPIRYRPRMPRSARTTAV